MVRDTLKFVDSGICMYLQTDSLFMLITPQ